jgi:hypothetical protein
MRLFQLPCTVGIGDLTKPCDVNLSLIIADAVRRLVSRVLARYAGNHATSIADLGSLMRWTGGSWSLDW